VVRISTRGQVRLRIDQQPEAGPDDGLVVGDHDADRHATRPVAVADAMIGEAAGGATETGRDAVTWKPPPGSGTASSVPPNTAARSRIPTIPS
jgi:hypothetical protein